MRVPNTPRLFILISWRENAIKMKKVEFFQCPKQGPKPGNFEDKAPCGQPWVYKWLEYSPASTSTIQLSFSTQYH